MSLKVLGLFLFAVILIYVGVTRMVAEGGLVFLRGPMIAQPFTMDALGPENISFRSLGALGVSYAWFCDIKAFFMAGVAHAVKLRDVLKMPQKQVLTAIAPSTVVAIGSSMWYTLYMGYRDGAYNYGDWIFRGGATTGYRVVVKRMQNPEGAGWKLLGWYGSGGLIMGILNFLRLRFYWWPIHPLGFAISLTLPVRLTAFSFFIAFLAKFFILKFGGIRLYRSSKPFFFGLILGHFTVTGISFVVDMIFFPGKGHFLYGW